MRKLPPLHALRAFEAAARHASITQAAQELAVSHSAISQQVRGLEDYFGQPLFRRPGRRVVPTDGAKLLLDELRIAFDRIAIASQQFSARTHATSILINATPSFAMRWLIPKTSTFQLQNPTVQLLIETSASDEIDHLSKSYDFIFRRMQMRRTDHNCLKVIDDHSTAVMAPSLTQAAQYRQPSDLIRNAVLLNIKSRPNNWKDWFEQAGVVLKEVPSGPYYDHFFLSLQAAISGLGIAVGPLCLIEDDIKAGRLTTPWPEYVLAGPGFHVLYPSTVLRSRFHRSFLDFLMIEGN